MMRNKGREEEVFERRRRSFEEKRKVIELLNYSASFYKKDCTERINKLAEILEGRGVPWPNAPRERETARERERERERPPLY